jgi:LysM repeat protein
VLIGLLIGFCSVSIVIGSFAISLAEGGRRLVKSTALTNTPTLIIQVVTAEPKASSTLLQQPFKTFCITLPQATASYTPLPPTPTANPTRTPTEEQISIMPSQTPTPTATNTKRPRSMVPKANISCGPPSSWVLYTIRRGDTLTRIGQAYGVSVGQLQSANCLGNSTSIQAGKLLYVPNVAPHPPFPTTKPGKSPKPTEKPAITKPPVIVTMPPPAALGNFITLQ